MKTQKIPFSIDKMKDAVRYETRDGREVIQVKDFDCCDGITVAAVIGGELEQFHDNGRYISDKENARDLLVIIEKPIEYPCLCWVSGDNETPRKDDGSFVQLMQSANVSYSGIVTWDYSTPLTDEELAELGLMRVEKCAN